MLTVRGSESSEVQLCTQVNFATSLLTIFERHLQEGEINGNMPNSVCILAGNHG